MEQLTFEDIVGNMDYTAHSTAAKFLSNHSVTPTYAVEFFDRDKSRSYVGLKLIQRVKQKKWPKKHTGEFKL